MAGTRLTGPSSLQYLGVEAPVPRNVVYLKRPPTVNDWINFRIGDFWYVENHTLSQPLQIWTLVSQAYSTMAGAQQGTWVQLYPSGGSVNILTLTGNNAVAVPPTAGNINVVGNNMDVIVTGNAGTSTLLIQTGPTVALQYHTDDGTAVAASGVLNIVGSGSTTTAATPHGGNTITINSTGGGGGGTEVGFLAYQSATVPNATGDGTVYPVICDTISWETGGGYDNTTGIFTAPVAGIYEINAGVGFTLNGNNNNTGQFKELSYTFTGILQPIPSISYNVLSGLGTVPADDSIISSQFVKMEIGDEISINGIVDNYVAPGSLTQSTDIRGGLPMITYFSMAIVGNGGSIGENVEFLAYLSANVPNATGDGTVYPVVFDTVAWETGGGYDNTTGIFEAPITGTYELSSGVGFNISAADNASATFMELSYTFTGALQPTPTAERLWWAGPAVGVPQPQLVSISNDRQLRMTLGDQISINAQYDLASAPGTLPKTTGIGGGVSMVSFFSMKLLNPS